jgi:beta-xylosidase
MEALKEFDVTLTFCFTPEHRGFMPHHTSAPLVPDEFARFCGDMIRRYAPAVPMRVAEKVGSTAA